MLARWSSAPDILSSSLIQCGLCWGEVRARRASRESSHTWGGREEGGREEEREGGREGGREGRKEGGKEGGRERGREGGRKGGREEGRKGGREGGREGKRDGKRERGKKNGRKEGGREKGGGPGGGKEEERDGERKGQVNTTTCMQRAGTMKCNFSSKHKDETFVISENTLKTFQQTKDPHNYSSKCRSL